MVNAASKLPVGSLAFIVSNELLFLRVQRGLRQIQVDLSTKIYLLVFIFRHFERHLSSVVSFSL